MESIIDNIIKDINKLRKNTSNGWYVYHNYDFNIHIKGYKTWLQICKINNVDYGHIMDISVKDFNSYLFNSLKEGLNVTT